MKTLRITGTDLDVSALCYGCGALGSDAPREQARRLYDAFREAGGNFFDTAHCYGFWAAAGTGASERSLGECARGRGDRRDIVIATKGGHPAFLPGYPRPDRYLAPEVIASDMSESLERLGVESIDLYLLHRDDRRVPVGEIIDTLGGEVARGRIRHIGASNWTVGRIAEANRYAASAGLKGFSISQPQWSLAAPNAPPADSDTASRSMTDEDAAWHADTQLPAMVYSPTARGYFATGGRTAKDAFDNPTSRARLERAGQFASRLGCTANQVALAWLMHQPFQVIPIIGTANPAHLQDAIAACGVNLSDEDVRWLREG